MAQLNLKRPIVFFDLETTGTNPAKDRIIEIALVKLSPEGNRDTWIKRINPGIPIPAEATAVHGITDADVKDAPEFRQIAKELSIWLRGCDFGGYNCARFDLPMLVEELLRAGVQVDFSNARTIDAQKIFFMMAQRNLSAAYKFFCNKTLENAHSAEADTLASIEVLEAQLDRYQELGTDVEKLHQLLADADPSFDYARTMILKKGAPYFNIGKHKGQKVEEVFTKDPSYYDWMMRADFSLDTKQKISEVLNKMKLAKLQK
ncbi:MAG: 3'-5' exonuclease [Bacteroidetes bacterium]|nr:3'-5' exonuclease [Bacteroidota bacterium]